MTHNVLSRNMINYSDHLKLQLKTYHVYKTNVYANMNIINI